MPNAPLHWILAPLTGGTELHIAEATAVRYRFLRTMQLVDLIVRLNGTMSHQFKEKLQALNRLVVDVTLERTEAGWWRGFGAAFAVFGSATATMNEDALDRFSGFLTHIVASVTITEPWGSIDRVTHACNHEGYYTGKTREELERLRLTQCLSCHVSEWDHIKAR